MTTVFITGANRGLGLEFTRQYAAEGCSVFASCRDPMEANDLASIAGDVNILRLDVTDYRAIDELAKHLKGQPIDILVNNAGTMGPSSDEFDIDMAAWEQTMRANALAPYKLSMALAGHVAASQEKKIVAITSRLGSITEASGGHTAYGSSKAALNFAMKNVSAQLAGRGICVAVFHPGWARTRMGGPSAAVDPVDSVTGMRQLTADLTGATSGTFYQYDGEIVPW